LTDMIFDDSFYIDPRAINTSSCFQIQVCRHIVLI